MMATRTGKSTHSNKESSIFGSISLKEIAPAFDGKNYLWNADGSIGQIVKFQGRNDSAFSAKEYNEIYNALSSVFSGIDNQEITIGFYQVRNSHFKELPEIPLNMPVQMTERLDFLKLLIQNNEVFKNNFYIAVNARPISSSSSPWQKTKGFFQGVKGVFTGEEDKTSLDLKYQNVKNRIKNVARVANQIQASLKGLGVQSTLPGSRNEYIGILRSIFAPMKSTIKDLEVDMETESLRRELFAGVECEEKKEFFIMDGYFHRLFELDRIPSRSTVGENSIQSIIDAPFEHVYGVVFRTMDYRETGQKMQKVVAEAEKQMDMAKDARGRVRDRNLVKDLERFNEADDAVAELGTKTTEFASFLVYKQKMKSVVKHMKKHGMDRAEFLLENSEMLYRSVFASVGMSEWICPSSGQWDAFCDYALGMANVKSNKFKTITDIPYNMSYLLPFFSRGREDLKYYGINHLFTDSLTTETFDIFDPDLPSYAYLISGDMGSGKSVALNLLISMTLSSYMVSGKAPIVRIIDYGGTTSSYFKLLMMMRGENINFNKTKKPYIQVMDLNPDLSLPTRKKTQALITLFNELGCKKDDHEIAGMLNSYYESLMDVEGKITDEIRRDKFDKQESGISFEDVKEALVLAKGECKPNNNKLTFLMGIFETMLSNNPNELDSFSTDFSRDDVLSFLDATYEKVEDRCPRISDLVQVLKDFNEEGQSPVIAKMISRFSKWTMDGQYKMFDQDTDINLENDFIMFDLYGLDSDPHLKAIYTAIIIDLVGQDMYAKMDRTRICVMDEAWSALSTKELRKFVVAFMRLSRKYKFAPMLASQLPTDYFLDDPKDGEVIVSQAKSYIFCGITDKTVINNTAHYYNLTESEAAELANLGVKTSGGTEHAPVYSRFMHIAQTKKGRRTSIFRNILSPFEYQLYSSSKEDNAIVRYYLEERKMAIEKTIKLLANREHIGDADLVEYLRKGNHVEAMEMVKR